MMIHDHSFESVLCREVSPNQEPVHCSAEKEPLAMSAPLGI